MYRKGSQKTSDTETWPVKEVREGFLKNLPGRGEECAVTMERQELGPERRQKMGEAGEQRATGVWCVQRAGRWERARPGRTLWMTSLSIPR